MGGPVSIIDSHCHLDHFHRKGALEEALQSAGDAGVDRMIAVGTNEADWKFSQMLAQRHPGTIYYSVGLHPSEVGDDWEEQVIEVAGFFQQLRNRPVALGEIGLDFFRLPTGDPKKAASIKALQLGAFRSQLELARRLECPVVIHSRGAYRECIEELDVSGVNWDRVVFHCFVEDGEAIRQINRRGGRGSFTGIVTFNSAEQVREAVKAQGLGKIMVETDAPYLAPVPHRGKPCQPAYAAITARYCSRLLDVEENEFAAISRGNTEAFFGL
ncbi:MAG: TatD family deoxyribonuclease [Opitutae bacterium]|nr:TatD family deoxyribonuclease [Opitutae bacterium]